MANQKCELTLCTHEKARINKKNGEKDALCAKIVYDTEVEENIEKVRELVSAHIETVNSKLIRYKQIVDFELTDVEMEKTTTGKIKRHLK